MSVITIQIGQCGNQIGTAMFSLLSQDALQPPQFTSHDSTENIVYKQDAMEKYFTEKKDGTIEAKAVLVDMEPKVIQKCKQTANQTGLWKYPSGAEYIQKRGSGNNWTLGYYGNGPDASREVTELCRKEIEKCDHFTGFLVLMSLAGGTGSGLGTHVTHTLRDEYEDAIVANHVVWPYSSGEVIVQNYNSLLTLSHLQHASDIVIGEQNDHVHNICVKLLGIKNISFQHTNQVLAHKLASILQPAYTHDYQKVNPLYDLVQSVATHPAYKLVSVKNIPHISEQSMAYSTYVWPALLKHLRQMLIADAALEEGVNWEVKVPLPSASGCPSDMRVEQGVSVYREKFNKSIANLLIVRGKDLHHVETDAFKTEQLYASVIPPPFCYHEWQQTRPFNRYEKSAALVSNSQTFIRPMNDCIRKAWSMFNARAYIHQYEKYGLTENDFIDSFGVVEQVVADYASI